MVYQVPSAVLEQNLARVQERIADAAARGGRGLGDIELVAITKGFPAAAVRQAYGLGLRLIGENRVAEGLQKQRELEDLPDIQWHMVGHIQSRKAADVAPYFDLVHSVDRTKIAHRLERYAAEAGRVLPILLECNVSGEESKGGWRLHERARWPWAAEAFAPLKELRHLEIRGLMTMAPWTADEHTLRSVFRRLRELRAYLSDDLKVDWAELSMGMSDDYEIAVEEGATMIRLGRAIFGERP